MQAERAFVAGATGLTGRFVVEALRARGIATVAHVRPDSPRLSEWRARFEALGAEVDTTPWNDGAICAAIATRQPTLVFALLGTTRARASRAAKAGGDASRESYDAVDVALTEMLIRACEAISTEVVRPRLVYLSSIGAGDGARGSYLEARTRVEKALEKSGVPYIIARPSFIVGDRDDSRPAEKLGAPVANALLGAIGFLGARRTADRYRSIRGEDLARVLVNAALDVDPKNRILEADALQALARSR